MRGTMMVAVMMSIALGAVFSGVAVAQTGIPYQGRLTDAGGAPINGARNLTLTLYNSGGTSLYQETQSVTVTNGLFSVEVGTGTPVSGSIGSINFGSHDLFLGITVGTDPEMAPRIHLGFSAYSMDAPGIATNHINGFTNFSASASVALVGVTITTPSAGFILFIAGGQIYAPAGFSIAAWISETPAGTLDGADYGDVSNPNATGQYLQYTRQRVYSKPAGTYQFYLNGGSSSVGGYLWEPTATAIFIPTLLGDAYVTPTSATVPQQPNATGQH